MSLYNGKKWDGKCLACHAVALDIKNINRCILRSNALRACDTVALIMSPAEFLSTIFIHYFFIVYMVFHGWGKNLVHNNWQIFFALMRDLYKVCSLFFILIFQLKTSPSYTPGLWHIKKLHNLDTDFKSLSQKMDVGSNPDFFLLLFLNKVVFQFTLSYLAKKSIERNVTYLHHTYET